MPPARGQGMEGITPTRPSAPLAQSQEMEEGGGIPTQKLALLVRSQGMVGETLTRPCAPPARIQEMEEVR